MIDKIKIGSFLRELRTEKGVTQEELAEKYGVSSRSVSRWENGNTLPELGILVELADYYDVEIKELIDGERKSESEKMNSESKETLVKIADYAKEHSRQARTALISILVLIVEMFCCGCTILVLHKISVGYAVIPMLGVFLCPVVLLLNAKNYTELIQSGNRRKNSQ